MKYYEELNMPEAMSISGGSASDVIEGGKKWNTHWSGTSNSLIYFGEPVYNGVVLYSQCNLM